MQRKFKLIEPKKETIAKWVTVSTDSQSASASGSPRVTISTSNYELNQTPKSVKRSSSPVYFKDDLRKTKTPKLKSKETRRSERKVDNEAQQNNLESQNVTPKVIYSPGIVRYTKDWRLDTNRSYKTLNSTCGTQRSGISGTGTENLDSSRVLFKTELRQNVHVSNYVTLENDSETDSRMPPCFSGRKEEYTNLQAEKMSETVIQVQKQSNLSNKVGESRKEIEKLKIELESLINTNLKIKNCPDTNMDHEPISTNNISNNLATVVKQNINVSPPKIAKSPSSVTRRSSALICDINKEESKSKAKSYDPETTREFIRIQKLRRKEKLHQEELKKKESEELKKQKLEVLKQKTLQLLTDNVKKSSSKKNCAKQNTSSKSNVPLASKLTVQLVSKSSVSNLPHNRKTRARSFDRDAIAARKLGSQKTLIESKENPIRRSRSVSRELTLCDKNQPLKNSSQPEEELQAVVTQISKMLNNEIDQKKAQAATKIQAAYRGYHQRNKNITKSESPGNVLSNNKAELTPPENKNITSKQLPECKTNLFPTGNKLPKSAITSVRLEEVIKTVPEEIKKSTNDSQKERKINGITHKCAPAINEDAIKEIETIKHKLETSISQSNLENKKNETPEWLLPPSTLPYPYNFISAVRKKLEIATRSYNIVPKDEKLKSPTTKDTSIQTLENKKQTNVSTQCSIDTSREIKQPSIPEIVPPKPEELKSYMSHKCRKQLVYDSPPKLRSPTNMKDIRKEITSENEKKSHSVKSKSKIIPTSEASDSDTTKNIPEISEEEQFSKNCSIKSDRSENTKNITFNRQQAGTNGKNFTFDQIKDKNSNDKSKKLSIKSENSDRLKNSFDRRSNHSSLEMSLVKPDYKIDTSKISKHSSSHHSNRSKYPSDIDSILTQYSKMKSLSKSSIQNDLNNSQYSEDFNSSPTHHLSLPKNQQETDKDSSLDMQTDTESRKHISKAKSSDLSKIKSEILASLARQHSSSLSSIPKQISESLNKHSEILTNQSTDINLESLNKVSSGSHLTRKSTDNILESLTWNTSEIKPKKSENKSRNSVSRSKETLSKNSSKITDAKAKSSSNTIKEFLSRTLSEMNSTVNEIKDINSISNNLESLNKFSSKLNSDVSHIKTNNSSRQKSSIKSDILDSKNSHDPQIRTDATDNKSHSKREKSVDTSAPDNILKTDTESAPESIIKSSIDESLKKEAKTARTDSTIEEITEKFENSKSKSISKAPIQALSKPMVNLKVQREKFFRESKNNPNQIHLKFQAEVHLLNSFNNSLQQVVAVEKSLLDIQEAPPAPTVNFARGCGAPEQMESLSVLEPSVCSQDLNISHMSDSVASETAMSIIGAATDRTALSETCVSNKENSIIKNPYVGVSLGMFDQMIRDEDNRLEHLKAILKLRDKALFDRTKGELAWLEIQKKQLRENGQLNDVTIIKKKQRGLIIKLEQERHEMQRLKLAHKQAAKERKNALREQKNIIKQQLSSTDHIPTKIRRLSQLERRQSGPVKVYRVESRTEQVTETTMSRNSSGTDETISVTTSSVVTQISEKVSVEQSGRAETSMALKPYPKVLAVEKMKSSDKHSEKVKKALLMKEADLEKRRKEAEELLKWHERLKQEEAQVLELERQTKSIQLDDHEKKRVLTGAQLNKIWKGITGSAEKKFDDQKKYQMSKRSLDKFYQNARKIFKEISDERNSSKRASEESYTSDFDPSHSPSKINLSSSIVTQINDTDLNISPHKMLSERLRRISESSRLDFIASSKVDTNISERTTISEKSSLSTDQKSVISEISSDHQNGADSYIQTVKDSSIHSENKSNSNPTVVSELHIISDHESVTSKKSRRSSTDSDIPELHTISDHEQTNLSEIKESVQSVDEKKNSSIDSNLPELLEESKSLDNKFVQEKSKNISTDSDLPELDIASESKTNSEQVADILSAQSLDIASESKTNSEQVKSADILSAQSLDIASEFKTNSEQIKSADILSAQSLDIASESKTNSEQIKSANILSAQSANDNISSKSSKISEFLSKSQNEQKVEEIVSEEIREPVQSIAENDSSIISEQLKDISKHDIKSGTATICSEISKTEKESEIKNDSNKNDSNKIITEPVSQSKLSSDISTESNENIHSENLTLKNETNISVSHEHIQDEEEDKIISEVSSKTTKSEENTSKIVDENILAQSDSHVPRDTELKSDIRSASTDETNKSVTLKDENQSSIVLEVNVDDSKSSNAEELSIIETKTFIDDQNSDRTSEVKSSVDENNKINSQSEPSHHSDIKSTILSSHVESKLLTKSESNRNANSDALIEDNTSAFSEINSKLSVIEDKTTNSEIKSSLPQEAENLKSTVSEKLNENSTSKSKKREFINTASLSQELSDYNLRSHATEMKNVESVEKLEESSELKSTNETNEYTSKPEDQNILYEVDFDSDKLKTEITDYQTEAAEITQNIQSEISTPRDSEPYYPTDFEKTNYTSETQTGDLIDESEVEKDLSISDVQENTETIKSSIETEKESTTIIETPKSEQSKDETKSETKDNSETFESDKDSTTIIESPKSVQISNKETEKSVVDENSEVLVSPSSESHVNTNLSKKSVSTEADDSFEDKDNSIEQQNEDKSVSGVSHIDVRKRVSEILADTTAPRGDKSPRLQDLYVTTYDVMTNSPENTPETGSPTNDCNKQDNSGVTIETPYKNEAEELLRKQLEIEQEIIQLERQQQNIPYLFMREIPNKPPPPYKPPNASVTPVVNSVIPVRADQIRKFVSQSAEVLYDAYITGNLKEASYKSSEDEKVNSQKFVFDLCKEIALEVCKPMEETRVPSWRTQKNKFQSLISRKPVNKEGLFSVMNRKVLQLLNFEPVIRKDNLIIRWSRKKRDHVDEILVLESQTEETEWTNYDADEQTIKDNLTSDIMDMLILETAQVMCEILKKKKRMSWTNYC